MYVFLKIPYKITSKISNKQDNDDGKKGNDAFIFT